MVALAAIPLRGLFMALPSVGVERLSELKEFKLKRSLVHFGLNKMATRVCRMPQNAIKKK